MTTTFTLFELRPLETVQTADRFEGSLESWALNLNAFQDLRWLESLDPVEDLRVQIAGQIRQFLIGNFISSELI